MNDKEREEINQVLEEIEGKMADLNEREYFAPENYREWYKDKKHQPKCGVQLLNYYSLDREKAKTILSDFTKRVYAFFKSAHTSSRDKKRFRKEDVNNALSDILAHWYRSKTVVMYNSQEQLLFYLYILVRVRIENEPLPDTTDQSYEEIVGKHSDKSSEQSPEKVSPSSIKRAHTLDGRPTILRGEEEAINYIDKIRYLNLIKNPNKYKVMQLYLENEDYSVRDIAEKTGVTKSTVARILKEEKG